MCVIVAIPKGSYLTKELAQKQWIANPDGGGFIYRNAAGVLTGYKSMDFNDFWAKFERARSDNKGVNFIVHFRIGTHGLKDISNVHPFQLPDGSWLAHNGIIHGVDDDPVRSDTRVFVDEVLPLLPNDWYTNKYLSGMVAEWIGWSKLAIMDPDGEIWLVNGDKGTKHEGMWFSNNNALPRKPMFTVNTKQTTTYTPSYSLEGGTYRESYVSMAWNWDSPLAQQQLIQERADIGLTKPIYWDNKEDTWYCAGCLETVAGEDYGWCLCYDAFDKSCGKTLEECECEEGDRDRIYDVEETPDEEFAELLTLWAT